MTITNLNSPQRYIGLSTDDKTDYAQNGNIIYYSDTEKFAIYHNSSWNDYDLTLITDLLGSLTDAAVVDPTASGSEIALLKGIIKQLQGDGTAGKSAPVDMATALDSDLDSINVDKMGKGSVTTAHSAITETATSAEIDCRGYNAILIEADISVAAKLWTFKVQGCMVSGGTFIDCYELANTGTMTLMSYQTNASKIFVFKGIPDYVKIVATEDEDTATVTVKVQPLNL